MKLRRLVAAAAVATTVAVAAPAATAQSAPEPLNRVLYEIYKVGGWEAQNIILLPAALSSLNVVISIIQSIVTAAK